MTELALSIITMTVMCYIGWRQEQIADELLSRHENNELRAERDHLREQLRLTREWLNAWEAGLFSADQCWVKLRSKLAERKDY